MLRLGQIRSTKKRKTTVAIAGAVAAAAIALAAIAMTAYPASYETIVNAVSNAFGGISRALAAMSEYVQEAIASAQNLLGQQLV